VKLTRTRTRTPTPTPTPTPTRTPTLTLTFTLTPGSAAWLCGARPGLRTLKGSVNACGVNNYVRVWFRLQLSALFSWMNPFSKEVERTKSGGKAVPTGAGSLDTGAGAGARDAHRLDEGEAADVISGEQAVGGGLLQGDPHDPRFEMSDMGWDLCPTTLGVVIDGFWRRYQLPILVTESGTADGDLHDKRRVRYLSGCLRAVHQAIGRGCDVRSLTLTLTLTPTPTPTPTPILTP